MTCHANDILLVKLQKKLTPSDYARFQDVDYQYDALGYYDYVGFSFIRDFDSLVRNSANGMVGGEHSILIPVSEKIISFDARPMGIVSYFMVDEKNNTDLIREAQKIETDMGENCKAYITMGASAIAVVCLYSDVENVVESSRLHIIGLQGHSQVWQNIMYTFSITFFSQVCEQQNCETIHSVYISFAWKAACAGQAQEFLTEVGESLYSKEYKIGIIPGTDDFFLHAIDVPFNNFMQLYGKMGMLSSEEKSTGPWYGMYCDSTYTVIGYKLQSPPLTSSAQAIEIDESAGLSDRIDDIRNRLNIYKDTGTINRLLDSIEAFQALGTSKYTSWVYRNYLAVVELFFALVDDELILLDSESHIDDNHAVAEISRESTYFFDTLEKMLGSLLNTSAYLTNSPGYRTIERNYIPRLLLCYQNIINSLVASWDAVYGKPEIERQHAFLLCVQDGAEPQAYMHFPKLPPDKRVINIMIPLLQAYQPAMLLPLLLHEAGHYVGVRLRSTNLRHSKSRDSYFIDLVARMLIRELLELMFGIKCDKLARCFSAPTDFIRKYTEYIDGEPTEYVAEVIHSFLAMYEYHDNLVTYITDEYNAYKQRYLEEEYGSPNGEMERRKKYAIESNYFSEMRAMMRVVITGVLNDEVAFFRAFERHIKLCIDQAPEQKSFFNRVLAGIIKRTRSAFQDCLMQIAADDGSDFISKSEGILSEIAADVFMVYGVHMTPKLYLCITFEQYARKKMPLEDIRKRFSQTTSAQSRVIAVYTALTTAGYCCSPNCYIDESMKRIAHLYDVDIDQVQVMFDDFVSWVVTKSEENDSANVSLWTVQLERMLSPISLATSYAKLLIKDERYAYSQNPLCGKTEEHKKLNHLFENIRTIYNEACNIGDDCVSLSECYRLLYDKA